MRKKVVRCGLVLVTIMTILFCIGCNAEKKDDSMKAGKEETKLQEEKTVVFAEGVTCKYEEAKEAGIKENSLEDIKALNDGECTILYNDLSEIQFIGGSYTDYRVTDWQQAYNSLFAVKNILKLDLEKVVPVKSYVWENGVTCYTFSEKLGGDFKQGVVIHIMTDEQGVVSGLSMDAGNEDMDSGKMSSEDDTYASDVFFEHMEATTAEAVDVSGNTLTIPVMYNTESKLYYLGDLDRKIIVGNYVDDLSACNKLPFLTSENNTWKDPQAVSALNHIISIYDYYYETYGWKSVDGTGIPIMAYVHEESELSTADYNGIKNDFAWINASDVVADNILVLAHEYTHGIFGDNSMGTIYCNDPGSVNEGYAYIMGSLVEMKLTESDQWLQGMLKNFPDMTADAYLSNFSSSYGDDKYIPPVQNPDYRLNDLGGVHYNAFLLVNIAREMNLAGGMSIEDEARLFTSTLSFMVSNVSYNTVEQFLILAAKLNHMDNYIPVIEDAFSKAGISAEMNKQSYLTTTKEGFGRVTVDMEVPEDKEAMVVIMDTKNEGKQYPLYENKTGTFTGLIQEGDYLVNIYYLKISEKLEISGDETYQFEKQEVHIGSGETVTVDAVLIQ